MAARVAVPHSPRMDLTFLGWIFVGLVAGSISGIISGGRTARGWMPSLFIGVIAGVLTGWFLVNVMHTDGITSIWLSALLATVAAILIRLAIGAFVFSDD